MFNDFSKNVNDFPKNSMISFTRPMEFKTFPPFLSTISAPPFFWASGNIFGDACVQIVGVQISGLQEGSMDVEGDSREISADFPQRWVDHLINSCKYLKWSDLFQFRGAFAIWSPVVF